MQLGFFNAGVGGKMAQIKLDAISHSLANANTTGYMEDHTSFSSFFSNKMSREGVPGKTSSAFISADKQYVSTQAGIFRNTGNNLDFAIHGDAYFRVKMPNGEEALTRAGNFKMDAEGNLLTQGNLAVLDKSGSPIQLPAGKISITDDGSIYVDNNTSDDTAAQQVAQLGLSSIKDARQIRKIAGVLLKTPANNIGEAGSSIAVRQGEVEASNVNSVLAMTKMIDTMRSYQSTMKIVEQFNQQAGLLNDRVGVVQG